jgi:hypothetical protein
METDPDPYSRMTPRLSCSKGGAKRRQTATPAVSLRNSFCHLGVTSAGCFNWIAPMAVAAMLTE